MDTLAQCSNEGCAHLRREVDALERLVDRYQQELVTHTACPSCGRLARQSLQPVEEELFEQQQLNGLQWTEPTGRNTRASVVPFLTRRNGERCSFDDVRLPSTEWVWASDWSVDVHSQSDLHGWMYAMCAFDFDVRGDCKAYVEVPERKVLYQREAQRCKCSDRSVEDRVRRRRWKRLRKFVGSKEELPVATAHKLEQERRLCDLQSANEKLTEQLRRANDQILDYEDRLKSYEAKLLELQRSQLHRPPPIQTLIKPVLVQTSTTSLFSPSKSREVLHQTEALLNQLLVTAPVVDEDMREAQRRRSQMVQECQSELDGAVVEFQHLVHTMDARPA